MLLDIKERMQAVLQAEAAAIAAIHIVDEFVRAVEVLKKCQGKIITAGVGKAGCIAENSPLSRHLSVETIIGVKRAARTDNVPHEG